MVDGICRTAVGDCVDCPLGRSKLPRTIGYGPLSAQVAVVGIAPTCHGPSEQIGAFQIPLVTELRRRRESIPRLSPSTRMFWSIATDAGWDLVNTYSTNAVKCALPRNREPNYIEFRACAEHLRMELWNLLNLRLVLAYGSLAGVALGLEHGAAVGRLEGSLADIHVLRHPTHTVRKQTGRTGEVEKLREIVDRYGLRGVRG